MSSPGRPKSEYRSAQHEGAPVNDGVIDIDFELNGQPVRHRCAPTRRLLTLLREDFGLTGAKPGCEVGRCGACMVWLNDTPANACLLMAWQLQGQRVITIEAVGPSERSAPVREALAQCGGLQCGYCTAGFVMTLTHLHELQPRPSAPEVARLACGNLCRCTGYGGVQRAIERLF
ncbi:(2Fe-2S)-binding protein [Sphaerotilaceae bacterium SBD11-9]